MKTWHVIVIAIIFYFIGAYYGTFGKQAVSTVTSAIGQ